MATDTKTKKKTSGKRTFPRKKAHREIIELQLTGATKEMLLEQLIMLDKALIRTQTDMMNFLMAKVVGRVIDPANAKLPASLQQTSLTLYSDDGDWRFSCNQQISRNFDDRAQQATALITDFINDHKMVETDERMGFLMAMLEAMLFGASRKKQFRHTPELQKFMAMKDEELPDKRLIQARDILNEAFYTHRSTWYYDIDVWDDDQKKYISHEEYLRNA